MILSIKSWRTKKKLRKPPALIQAVFHVVDRFWVRENRRPKKLKTIFFQDKLYYLKAHVFIYLETWRAVKLGIFTHFTFTNLPGCSQSMNLLIHVCSIQIPSCFQWVLNHIRDHTSSYYRRPIKFSVLPPRPVNIPCLGDSDIDVYQIIKNRGPCPYNFLSHSDNRKYLSGRSLTQNRS